MFQVLAVPYFVLYQLYTLFLFTKSDIKTTVIPITVLAAAAAPLTNISHLPHIIFWVWFHVLQFDVSNQTLDPEEDEHNKRDRPLPAKRISYRNAVILRWALVPACWTLSACYSLETMYASMALVALTAIYDEFGAHSGHWAVRNLVNALGFVSFEVGASLIAGNDRHFLDNTARLSVLCSAGIFFTTIQSQDFKDVEGDTLIGRQTIPIVHPTIAAPTLALLLQCWALGLAYLWHANLMTTIAISVLSLWVGACYLRSGSVKEYQRSFYLYNVWLTVMHGLPLCWRMTTSALS
ncbi:hypothetical protein SCHPADRAFT_824462 [Schizopora paradoxa]|uniref:UbiA prenyltransferase n=1 Tax=Schizopora paradoxa TaxID=27342 RepID=A0A0H2SEY5_9AGAM|nr:hypothetical protein SCHPADRAFT_824462 [Schizopora paradoxa]